jgi:HEAT repeat protein
MARFLAALSLGLVLVLLGATARAEPPVERVRALLSGYEQGPTAGALRALGPGTLDVLMTLAEDPAERLHVRLRALGATAHFPEPRTRAFLLRVARQRGQDELLARQAVAALSRGFGVAAMDELTGFLRHEHAFVRRVAARGLARIGTEECKRRLRRHLDEEPDPVVRRAVERALTGPPG